MANAIQPHGEQIRLLRVFAFGFGYAPQAWKTNSHVWSTGGEKTNRNHMQRTKHVVILATKLIISVATNEMKVTKSKTHCAFSASWQQKKKRSQHHRNVRDKCKSCVHINYNENANRNKQNETTQKTARNYSRKIDKPPQLFGNSTCLSATVAINRRSALHFMRA